MRDKSSMSLFEFLWESVFWALGSWFWYNCSIFRCIDGWTYGESRILLGIIVVLSVLVGAFFTCRFHRNGWNIAISLFTAYGIYTIIAYDKTFGTVFSMILIISGILALIYAFRIFFRRIRSKKNFTRILGYRLYKCIHRYQTFAASGMGAFMIMLVVSLLFGNTLLGSSVKPAKGALQEYTITTCMDSVLLLQEEAWTSLSVREKLDVLQIVANIEANYLGLPHELNVSVANLSEGTLGCYIDNRHLIQIDLTHLEKDTAHRVLDTVTHEAYHSYQYRLVDAYYDADENVKGLRLYREAISYAEEFNAYVEGDEEFHTYYLQECEKNSRAYAEDAVNDYYHRIAEYLSGESD